jgi:hypothetical protein
MTPTTDGGPWRGPTEDEWIRRIAEGSRVMHGHHDENVPWMRLTTPDEFREEGVKAVPVEQPADAEGARDGLP